MNISIQLQMPDPDQKPPVPQKSIEDKVREAVDLCESGYCSETEFLMLRKMQAALKQKKPNPRVQNLLEMIQPVLNKYGYHDLPIETSRSTSGHDTPANPKDSK